MQTFLKNGYIVSMDQNDTVFDGGGVLVENDRITAVGRVDPAKISPDAEVIDLRGKYVLRRRRVRKPNRNILAGRCP